MDGNVSMGHRILPVHCLSCMAKRRSAFAARARTWMACHRSTQAFKTLQRGLPFLHCQQSFSGRRWYSTQYYSRWKYKALPSKDILALSTGQGPVWHVATTATLPATTWRHVGDVEGLNIATRIARGEDGRITKAIAREHNVRSAVAWWHITVCQHSSIKFIQETWPVSSRLFKHRLQGFRITNKWLAAMTAWLFQLHSAWQSGQPWPTRHACTPLATARGSPTWWRRKYSAKPLCDHTWAAFMKYGPLWWKHSTSRSMHLPQACLPPRVSRVPIRKTRPTEWAML